MLDNTGERITQVSDKTGFGLERFYCIYLRIKILIDCDTTRPNSLWFSVVETRWNVSVSCVNVICKFSFYIVLMTDVYIV